VTTPPGGHHRARRNVVDGYSWPIGGIFDELAGRRSTA
jgi:hypothetical protein